MDHNGTITLQGIVAKVITVRRNGNPPVSRFKLVLGYRTSKATRERVGQDYVYVTLPPGAEVRERERVLVRGRLVTRIFRRRLDEEVVAALRRVRADEVIPRVRRALGGYGSRTLSHAVVEVEAVSVERLNAPEGFLTASKPSLTFSE